MNQIHKIMPLLLTMMIGMQQLAAQTDPLLFPVGEYNEYTIAVASGNDTIDVTYRAYMHLPYVAQPVDKDYQSLNVFVPVKIDGKVIDPAKSPIFFQIGVGGYLSVNNARTEANLGSDEPEQPQGGDQNRQGPPQGGRPPMGQGGPPPQGGRPPQRDGEEPSKQKENGRMGGMIGPRGDENVRLALTYGYVVVAPGCRGRDNQNADGKYYGKAPAAIVDLKAAVRYVRYNEGIMPGNTEWIVSRGCSAGGAISALLGASGNDAEFKPYFDAIGAANERDDIFASAAFSPIADLEHADAAYEWMYGNVRRRNGTKVDQDLSQMLQGQFSAYQKSLQLEGKGGFGTITAENYQDYLLQYYLTPSVNEYLKSLSNGDRKAYLLVNDWIIWKKKQASFSYQDYLSHIGRMKGIPAFDDFEMKQPEPGEFGNAEINSRHFTDFSLQQSANDPDATVDPEVKNLVNLMNPMYFVRKDVSDRAPHWWIRNGTSDGHTSQTVAINLATILENKGEDVNAMLFWDAGHCEDADPEGLMQWIGVITGFEIDN